MGQVHPGKVGVPVDQQLKRQGNAASMQVISILASYLVILYQIGYAVPVTFPLHGEALGILSATEVLKVPFRGQIAPVEEDTCLNGVSPFQGLPPKGLVLVNC